MKSLIPVFLTLYLLLFSCSSQENTPSVPSTNKNDVAIIETPQLEASPVVDTISQEVEKVVETQKKISTTPELNLFVFEEGGMYGYKNDAGKVILEANYEMANDFVNGMAEVIDEEGWAFINGYGELLARPLVLEEGPDYFQEGLVRFTEDSKIGFLDENGNKAIAAAYSFAHSFQEGYAMACMGCEQKEVMTESGLHQVLIGGKWGLIDKKGQWKIACEFDEIKDAVNGNVQVKSGEEWQTLSLDEK